VRRLSLRARLLLGVVALAAVGLVVADVATYASLRSFLLDRVDSSLESGHPFVERAAFGQEGEGGPPGGGPGPPAQGIDWFQVRTLGGLPLRSSFLVQGSSPPKLPDRISVPSRPNTPDGERTAYFTVPARSGGGRYRVRASIEPQEPDRMLVIATSLAGVDGTLHRLFLIELLATGAVLVAIGGLGLWAVRLGLRPLREIEKTSEAIAAGDLTRRVERADEQTEVGRLGIALNTMLAQIESAFRAREASERRLRRFVADASHELRTPLAAVRAYAELFTRGAASRPDDLERSMAGIGRETERMSLLVEDLLLLARLDEGRPLAQEPVPLAEVVEEAVDAARVVDPVRPYSVEVEPSTVIGDRDRLRQIVDNLLANVRAHTPPETPVRVGLRRVNGAAEITVSDSGPGLTADELDQVFERFYRADTSRSRASGGAGLGLSIVAAVARTHGGDVTARSGAGEGATFVIDLPLAPDQDGHL
jgi:two-component system OmpR family sensor kinase